MQLHKAIAAGAVVYCVELLLEALAPYVAPFHAPAAPRSIQLTLKVPGKAKEDGTNASVPAFRGETSKKRQTPGFELAQFHCYSILRGEAVDTNKN